MAAKSPNNSVCQFLFYFKMPYSQYEIPVSWYPVKWFAVFEA